jgi:transcription antitermination factor NusA-like protein
LKIRLFSKIHVYQQNFLNETHFKQVIFQTYKQIYRQLVKINVNRYENGMVQKKYWIQNGDKRSCTGRLICLGMKMGGRWRR